MNDMFGTSSTIEHASSVRGAFGDKVLGLAPWAVFSRGFAAEKRCPLAPVPTGLVWPRKTLPPDAFSSEAAFHDSLGRSLAKP